MKILNASQLSELDQYTCKEQEITSWELMERAAKLAFEKIRNTLKDKQNPFTVLSGPGNNGGDGLALAYFLAEDGFKVQVYLINYTSSRSKDNQTNLERLQQQTNCSIIHIDEDSELPVLNPDDLIIDAIFGVGLNRPMPEFVQKLVCQINQHVYKVISIDVPSGMYLDKVPNSEEKVFQSDLIISFQTPKLPFFLPDYSKYINEVDVVDIGLSKSRLNQISTQTHLVDLDDVKQLFQPRKRFSHKGTYGHAVLVGGSKNMLGSVLLSSGSCLRSGVGKLSVMMPSYGHSSLLQYLPEAMFIDNSSEDFTTCPELNFDPDAIGIGIGLGQTDEALESLKSWLQSSNSPMVIDADALNLIAKHKALQQQIPKKSILTPHPGELSRLIGDWDDGFQKIEKIKSFSKALDVVVLAKDAYSLCVYGDYLYINSTGNSGMATAGSGDVLTGLITGLLAQGYSALNAALLGAFVHGMAGDIALETSSEQSLIASDIIDSLRYSFRKLQH
jgi:hydroxyethylthiazole kinase-like uncharacterized protein yjeF